MSDSELIARAAAAGALLADALQADGDRRYGERAKPFAQTACSRVLADTDDQTLRLIGLWTQRQYLADEYRTSSAVVDVMKVVARRARGWTPEEALALLRWTGIGWLGEGNYLYPSEELWRIPLAAITAAATRCTEEEFAAARPRLAELADFMRDSRADDPDHRRRVLARVEPLLAPGRGDAAAEDRRSRAQRRLGNLLSPQDGLWALIDRPTRTTLALPEVVDVLEHCAGLPGLKPSGAWLRRGRELVDAAPDGDEVLCGLLQLLSRFHVVEAPGIWQGGQYLSGVWLHNSTLQTARGVVALASELRGPGVAATVGDVAVAAWAPDREWGNQHARLANVAIATLERMDDAGAVHALVRVRGRMKNLSIRKGVDRALDVAARRAGMPRADLLDSTVPDCGLTEVGLLRRSVGAHVAIIEVAPSGASLRFENVDGNPVRSVPAAVRSGYGNELAALRKTVKEIGKALSAQRVRIEDLSPLDKTWDAGTWTERYLDHPLLGVLTRALIWQVGTCGAWRSGLPDETGVLRALDGSELPVDGHAVRLWHPALVAPEEVAAWRDLLVHREFRQPFKQAFREIYPLTPAEVEAGQFSNRFAEHIVYYPRFGGVLRARGWVGAQLAYWEDGQPTARKEFGDWRATLACYAIESDLPHTWNDGPALAGTDRVSFQRRVADEWRTVDLAEVPPLVFSEAMRDVDLFVAVSSIAGDAQWLDAATGPARYWADEGFGPLSETARTRKDVLERLLPRTVIADRSELRDRFLVVRGDLRTYKIHLGSGNILMEPNDAYLCIVPRFDPKAERVWLPFEEDGRLGLILSKAFLLADDAAIDDQSILTQIRA